MKKLLLILIILVSLSNWSFAQQAVTINSYTGNPDMCLWISETDGSPSNMICGPIKVTNGTLTDNADGTYTLGIPNFNMSAASDQLIINQTSSAGTEWVSGNPTGLIWVNDDRTGTTVNEKQEATLVIDTATGAEYGIYDDGKLFIGDETELYGKVRIGPATTNYLSILSDGYLPRMFADVSNVLQLIDDANAAKNHDHTTQTNPTFFIQSALDPDISNNQWASFNHNQTDFDITTGANIGVGTSPTTIANSINLKPQGTQVGKFLVSGFTLATGMNEIHGTTQWNNGDNIDATKLTGSIPQISTLTSGKWCTTNGTVITCTEDAPAGSGDVTGVGDCSGGACFDGTSDGGTNILFYDAQGATTLQVGDNAGAVALTLPNATGTLARTADNVATATAFAADPADCGANTCATEIAANGALTCSITPLVNDNIDASSELLAIMDDETGSASGSPLLVFNQNPTIAGMVGTGLVDFGGATLEIPHGTSDTALNAGEVYLNTTDEQLSFHSAADGEISGEASISLLRHWSASFDPAGWYDQESTYRSVPVMYVGDDAPEGITITEWKVFYVGGNPTTELDMDLVCDTTPDFNVAAGATVMDVLDTTAGASTADTGFDSASCANGAQMYLHFGADPTDANVVIAVDIFFYNEED